MDKKDYEFIKKHSLFTARNLPEGHEFFYLPSSLSAVALGTSKGEGWINGK